MAIFMAVTIQNIAGLGFLAVDDSEESVSLGLNDPLSSDLEFGFDDDQGKGQQHNAAKRPRHGQIVHGCDVPCLASPRG